jgi:hypothetical protein
LLLHFDDGFSRDIEPFLVARFVQIDEETKPPGPREDTCAGVMGEFAK